METNKEVLLGIIESSTGTFECSTLTHALLVKTNYRGDYRDILSESEEYCEKLCDAGIIKKSNNNGTTFAYNYK